MALSWRFKPLLRRGVPSLLSCCLLGIASGLHAETDAPQGYEHELKAAYLLNFGRFTEWPVAQQHEPYFNLCVLGDNPFVSLQAALEQETIGSQPVRIKPAPGLSALDAAASCHLMFFSLYKNAYHGDLAQLSGLPILTVGESDDFVANGGLIQFVKHDGRLQFGINLEQLKTTGLIINPHLLERALFTYPPQATAP